MFAADKEMLCQVLLSVLLEINRNFSFSREKKKEKREKILKEEREETKKDPSGPNSFIHICE